MRFPKSIELGALLLIALTMYAPSASATTLTSPAGTPWTGTFGATSPQGSDVQIHTPNGIVHTCEGSNIQWQVESHGAAVTAKGPLTQFTIKSCAFTVIKLGSLELHKGDGSPTGYDRLTWSGAPEVKIGNCVYSLEIEGSIELGILTGSPQTLGTATIDMDSQKLPAKSFFCGTWIELTGIFSVYAPDYLAVD